MLTAEEHRKPSGKLYVYYRCSRRKKGIVCREPAVAVAELEEQIVEVLGQLSIPKKTLAWLTERVETSIGQEEDRREKALAALEATRSAREREMENLLSLRLRDLVDDPTYVARRRAIDAEREHLLAKLAAPGRSGAETTKTTVATFDFAARVAALFRSGTGVQKRMILEAVGLNYEMRERKVAFQLKNPFRMISEAGGSSAWSACADAVRTWLQDTTEYFKLPDIDLTPNDVSIPGLSAA